jgi:hypothetical protein
MCGVQKLGDVLVFEKEREEVQFDVGIDVPKTFSHQLYLRLPDSGLQGGQLAVDIARLHSVGVDKRHLSDACTAYHLGSVSTYTAQSDYHHMGCS